MIVTTKVVGHAGFVRRCPLCRKILANSQDGIRSHLKKHVRNGELKAEQEADVCSKIYEPHVDFKK